MTVKELKEELSFFDDDMEVIFNVDCDFEPYSVTEDRYGNRQVRLQDKLKIDFIGPIRGDCYIELTLLEE